MKKIAILLMFLISMPTLSQTGKLVLKIKDKNYIPIVEKELTSNKLIIKSDNTSLTETFERYNLYKFNQLLPSSKRPELLKYYILETERHKELIKELNEKHSDKFSDIREYQEPKPLYIPNDYDFTIHTGVDGLRDVGLSYLELISAPEVWDITKGDTNVIIGIHDTYVDVNHEDLVGKIFKVYDDNIRSEMPVKPWHGTMVAGIAGAKTDNDTGLSSIGYYCRIAKTTDNKNDLLIMAQEGIKIINISQDWGDSTALDKELMEELTEDYNVTVVAAAGNDDDTEYIYPASYDNVISVTSVGHEFDRGTTFNGRQFNWKDCHKKYINPELPNTTHQHNDKVDICAPGYNIVTTCDDQTYYNGLGEPTGQIYSIVNGTSFAAPLVAGVCALMYSINPGLIPSEVMDIIEMTTDDIYSIPENAEYIGLLGAGRINAYEAVKEAGTTYLTGLQYSKELSAGYGFILNNVIINNNSNVSLTARKVVEINGTFQVPLGSTFEIEIDPLAVTSEE